MPDLTKFPLYFFENILKLDYLEKLYNKFHATIYKHGDHILESNEDTITTIDTYSKTTEHSFRKHLKPILYRELKNSKILLDEEIISFDGDTSKIWQYLIVQVKKLQHSVNKGGIEIIRVPEILETINLLIEYINKVHLPEEKDSFEITEDYSLEILESNRLIYSKTSSEIIDLIFGYLNGENEKQEKIMTTEQYMLMIEYVNHLVDKKEVPKIKNKIEKLNITKSLLRFTFWVLHKELYTSKTIKEDYINFLIAVFQDFENWEFKNLKKVFGNKSGVNSFEFIPNQILKYLKN